MESESLNISCNSIENSSQLLKNLAFHDLQSQRNRSKARSIDKDSREQNKSVEQLINEWNVQRKRIYSQSNSQLPSSFETKFNPLKNAYEIIEERPELLQQDKTNSVRISRNSYVECYKTQPSPISVHNLQNLKRAAAGQKIPAKKSQKIVNCNISLLPKKAEQRNTAARGAKIQTLPFKSIKTNKENSGGVQGSGRVNEQQKKQEVNLPLVLQALTQARNQSKQYLNKKGVNPSECLKQQSDILKQYLKFVRKDH